jgi:hypothetical protein
VSGIDLLVDRLREVPLSEDARADLTELAASTDPATRRSLIAVLSRPGTTDAARLAVLSALEATLIESDIEEIARVSVRQRSSVLGPTLELLGSFPTAHSLFALTEVFALRDDAFGQQASTLAGALRGDVAEAVALDSGADQVATNGDAETSLAYAAAASDPHVLVTLRGGEMTPLKLQLEEELALLDERLQARTKAAGGSASEFDARLRDELYEVMALTALPADERIQARALENLFRRTDLSDVEALAPALPYDVQLKYVTRSLTRANRRGARTDRAVFALKLLRDDGELWQTSRPAVIECLDEDAVDVQLAASVALARHAAELEPDLRRRLAKVFGAFDGETQQRLADEFAPILATDADEVDLASFIGLIKASTSADLQTRLNQLIERLTPEASLEDARLIATAFFDARADLETEVSDRLDARAVEAFTQWIRGRGRRTVEAAQTIVASPPAVAVFANSLGSVVEALRVDQARVLVGYLMEQGGLARVASTELEAAQFERVVLSGLGSAVASDPQSASAIFEDLAPVAQRRFLAAAISALGRARRTIAELSKSSEHEEIAALQNQLAQVLSAVDSAERAASGNDDLLRHFAAIRQAVSSLNADDAADTVPQGVRDWRLDVARRLPQIVQATDDGGRPLRLEGDLSAHAQAVLGLLAEIDQRANSPRVVSADARPHHTRDLKSCVTSAAQAGLLDDPNPLEIPPARTSLAQAASSAWAARHAGDAQPRLSAALQSAQDAGAERRLVLQIDALSSFVSDREILDATVDLGDEQLETAWRRVRPALVSRTKELEGLARQVRERSATAMERVADGLAPSLRAIESVMASYFRLRRLLSEAGWRQVEDTLGRVRSSEDLDHQQHQVVGSIESEEYLVRTLGIRVRSQVADKAIVEALTESEEHE